MTDARNSQTYLRTLEEPVPSDRVSQSKLRSVFNYPTDANRTSQLVLRSFDEPTPDDRTSQSLVRAIIRGRVAEPVVRAWTYSMDGHDFYVLRLGDTQSFVYDMYSEQWVDWTSTDRTNWRASRGINWSGGVNLSTLYGSDVVVGDDTWGLLWFLDPLQGYDDNVDTDRPEQRVYFERIAMGQVAVSGRTVVPCYVAHLTANQGEPVYPGAGVTLYTSDNGGITFDDHGTIEITTDEYSYPQLSWYSLGQIRAPGRLFKIIDDGAVARIDSLDINDDG